MNAIRRFLMRKGLELGQRLKKLRQNKKITQSAIAKQMGISQKAISDLENRGDFLFSTLEAYVRSLGGVIDLTICFPSEKSGRNNGDPAQLALTDLFYTQSNSQKDIVFSIHPQHVDNILAGKKTVELRRRFSSKVSPGTRVLIYSTSPTKALTGVAEIREINQLALSTLWKRYRSVAGIQKKEFENYFSGLKEGYAISLSSVKQLRRQVSLTELRERVGFRPPQSYQYASPQLSELISHERH